MKHPKHLMILLFLLCSQFLFSQETSSYFFSKILDGNFEEVTQKVKTDLKNQGFGVVTEIDMDKILNEKLPHTDLKPYRILGVCNPGFAYETLQIEENIGLFLPCKILVKDLGDGKIEVVMVNPTVLMGMLGKEELKTIADDVTVKFRKALDDL